MPHPKSHENVNKLLFFNTVNTRYMDQALYGVREAGWSASVFSSESLAIEELEFGLQAVIARLSYSKPNSLIIGAELVKRADELDIPRTLILPRSHNKLSEVAHQAGPSDLVIEMYNKKPKIKARIRSWLGEVDDLQHT